MGGLVAFCCAVGPAQAATLSPTAITVGTPTGDTYVEDPFTDDVFLDTLVFGPTTFDASTDFSGLSHVEILEGRSVLNAEWGDDDTGADGHADPFTRLGHDPSRQESVSAGVQDATVREALNSMSLSELVDGEARDDKRIRGLFAQGLTDNDTDADTVPELVLFERGMNDAFSLRLILGGTFDTPVFSAAREVRSADFWDTGVRVNTTEIGGAQAISVGAFDFNDFGLETGETVYGFEVFAAHGNGVDLGGVFLTSTDANRFTTPMAPAIPVPMTLPLLGSALVMLGVWRVRRARG